MLSKAKPPLKIEPYSVTHETIWAIASNYSEISLIFRFHCEPSVLKVLSGIYNANDIDDDHLEITSLNYSSDVDGSHHLKIIIYLNNHLFKEWNDVTIEYRRLMGTFTNCYQEFIMLAEYFASTHNILSPLNLIKAFGYDFPNTTHQ